AVRQQRDQEILRKRGLLEQLQASSRSGKIAYGARQEKASRLVVDGRGGGLCLPDILAAVVCCDRVDIRIASGAAAGILAGCRRVNRQNIRLGLVAAGTKISVPRQQWSDRVRYHDRKGHD